MANTLCFGRRIYVDPYLPISSFETFTDLVDSYFPGSLGQINHSRHFCLNFGRTMSSHLRLCVALQHWACVPALGLPSDFARILDGFTCCGEPCQVLVHVVTLPSGDIAWLLLDVVPNATQATIARTQHQTRTA